MPYVDSYIWDVLPSLQGDPSGQLKLGLARAEPGLVRARVFEEALSSPSA